MSFNPGKYLRRHAVERPDQVALWMPTKGYTTANPEFASMTFLELDRRSDGYARGLAAKGLKRGDRTVMLVKPSLEFYAIIFGVMKLGAVPVLLDAGMGAKALLKCIEENKPRAVIAIPPVMAVSCFVRKPFASADFFVTVGAKWFWGGFNEKDVYEDGPDSFPLPEMSADEDMGIVFTSGSTGTPKGVAWHQGLFAAQVESVAQMLGMTAGKTELQCFASFAIHDICWGQTCVLPQMDLSKPATAKPEDIAAAIAKFNPDYAFASPIVWINVGRWAEQNGKTFPSLEKVFTTGAPIPVPVHTQYKKILREGTEFWTPYGSTESIPVSYIATNEILGETQALTRQGQGTCVGWPAPGVDIHIVRVTDSDIAELSAADELPQGQIGEIVVGGAQISREYKEKPEANRASKIRYEGRILHRMGDLGSIDEKGRLWFCGRKAHRLETEGGMVPNVPVEGMFNNHPEVLRTALVGIGPRAREIPVLCVEMQPGKAFSGNTEQELIALARGTRWEGLVKRFLPHPGFPTDARHNSKIRNDELRQWAEQRCGDLLTTLKGAA
jgi:acyl-CoA synthetase (AMP-forming)/AMP-acid ligase II